MPFQRSPPHSVTVSTFTCSSAPGMDCWPPTRQGSPPMARYPQYPSCVNMYQQSPRQLLRRRPADCPALHNARRLIHTVITPNIKVPPRLLLVCSLNAKIVHICALYCAADSSPLLMLEISPSCLFVGTKCLVYRGKVGKQFV